MRVRTVLGGLAAACLLGAASVTVAAGPESDAPKMSPEQQAMMEAWTKAATPGEAHKALDPMIGSWNVATTSWQTPSAPPEKGSGTSENAWIFGGRFVRQEFDGEFGGMKFQGIGYTGYDNVKKQYVGTWMDTMGTTIMVMTGQGNPSGEGLVMHSTLADAVTGKPMALRTVTRIVDENKHVFEMFAPDPSGKEFRMMEIVYTRR